MPVVTVSAPVSVPTDAELLADHAVGERAALDELFRRYRLLAYRVAYRLLGNEADALDATQNGFIKAFTNLERFRGHSSFKTWLMRIICNASLDLGRQRKRDSGNDSIAGHEPLEADECAIRACEMERAELRRNIDAALAKLPESQRQTFVLHVDGELTYREVAETLGISMGTVMSRLYYARQKLKILLADTIQP